MLSPAQITAMPEEICHVCGSTTFVPHAVAPTGILHSYTTVHHSVHPALDAAVPYAVELGAAPGSASSAISSECQSRM